MPGATGSGAQPGSPGQRRWSLREIETELKAKGFQNPGSVLTKILKVNDARLRKAAAMKRIQEAKG
jgi:hypothetical protein